MLVAAAILGFAFGFLGSIPVAGPVALLVLRRGLEGHVRSAFYVATGAALAEGAYAYLAFRGFADLLARYAWVDLASRMAIAPVLAGLGLHFLQRTRHPAPPSGADASARAQRSFGLGLAITALNPALIATWAVAVSAMYSLDLLRFDRDAALPFSLGAFSGITAWFALLLGLLQRYRTRLSGVALGRLQRAMGVLFILLAAVVAAGLAPGS